MKVFSFYWSDHAIIIKGYYHHQQQQQPPPPQGLDYAQVYLIRAMLCGVNTGLGKG
jgi:hypothetical protein